MRSETVVLDTRVVTGTGGGPEKTILNSPRFLAHTGYRMLCAYLHPPDDPGWPILRQRAEACGAPLISVPDRGRADCRPIAALLELCRREQVAIWHGHDYKSNAIGLVLRRFWPMRLVSTVHGWVRHAGPLPWYYRVDRACLRAYERVLCVSDDLRAQCLASGVPADRCQVLRNGIDTAQWQRPARVRPRPTMRRVIGAVGRLSVEKGFDLLIQAIDRLLTRGYDLELRIAGEGDQEQDLRRWIGQLGWTERIRLQGFVADPQAFYRELDLFVLSSRREGLPNVLLEAMAMELPVVATRIAGVPGLIEAGRNGLLVEPENVEALAGAIAALLDDQALATRLAGAGRVTVETQYSFAARMDRLRTVYDELLGTAAPSCPQAGGVPGTDHDPPSQGAGQVQPTGSQCS